jgi:hypothetical protein
MALDYYKCFQQYREDFCSLGDFLCQVAKSYAYFSNFFPTASALFVENHWVLVAQGEKESVAGDSGGITIGLRVQTTFHHYTENSRRFGPLPIF